MIDTRPRIDAVRKLKRGQKYCYYTTVEMDGLHFATACTMEPDLRSFRTILHKMYSRGMILLIQERKETGTSYYAVGRME